MTTKTLKTLSTTELDILTAFGYQVSTWQNTHGDDASIVKIEYSDDTGDFEITTGKMPTTNHFMRIILKKLGLGATINLNKIEILLFIVLLMALFIVQVLTIYRQWAVF